MQVSNRANLSPEQLARINSEVAKHHTLPDILRWGFNPSSGATHPQVISDVIIQDEYSHDVIVPWREGLLLVYGTT